MSDGTAQPSGNTPATVGAPAAAPAAAAATGAPAAAPAAAAAAAANSQQATEGQTAAPASQPAAGKTEGDNKGASDGKPAGAPEKYEFTAPQGITMDADTLTAFSEVAKELNLPQDAAQKVIDKLGPKLASQNAKALSRAIQQSASEWVKATQSDPEIGGEKLGENLAVAKRGFEHFASPELRQLLGAYHPQKNPKGTGLGNHPEFVRLFVKLGKGMSEDKFVNGNREPSKEERNAATVLYGNKQS